MTTTVWILIAVVALLLLVWLVRGKSEPQLEHPEPRELKPAPKRKPKKPKKSKAPALADKPKEAAASPPEATSVEELSAPVVSATLIEPAQPPPAPIARRKRDVAGLRQGLSKVRDSGGLFGRLKALFGGSTEIDPALLDELEEILLTSDVGVKTTHILLEEIREALESDELRNSDAVWSALRERASQLLDIDGGGAIRNHGVPTVVLMVGVNGSGKTTTIGKLATKLKAQDKKVLMVAGDTFRAAAVAQLQAWGNRVGCEVFAGEEGADPASVVFDAVQHGVSGAFDIILVDTAGRLHTKSNLMDELSKVVRTCGKACDAAPHETLLVVDGTTGQNAVQQAAHFGEELELSGIVLTKLDGTAKGGVVLAIAQEQSLAVRYIGVGERAQDLRDFDSDEFIEAMLGQSDDGAAAA